MPDAASVIAAGRDLRGRGGIFRIDVRSGRTAQLVHLDGNTGRPQVSPDGNKIYYAVGGSSLRSAVPAEIELNLTTGDTREVFRRTNNMQAAELSPDGKYMAVVVGQPSNQTTLNLYPVDGSSPRELMQIKAPNAVHGYGGVSWTPDSSAVVAMVATADKSEPRELWLVPVDGNKPRKLAIDPTKWAGAGIRLSSNGKEIAFKIGDDSREVWAIGSIMPTAPAAQR
jgi:Tol biopolymer transport system component